MVKLDDHSRVVKPARGHEWLQGVPLHQAHRISELWIFSEGREIIINLCVHIPLTVISIPWNRAAKEVGPPNDRCRGQIRREIFSMALSRW